MRRSRIGVPSSIISTSTVCDIAIIGAGLSGVATAYHLSEQAGINPPSIVILEARQVCSGATGRNGGHCKVKSTTLQSVSEKHGPTRANEFAKFVNDQIHALKRTVEKEKLDCEFELRRSYDVFLDADEADNVEAGFSASLDQDHLWTRDRSLVDASFAEQLTSVKDAKTAISSPICSFWPYKFVTQLLSRLVERDAVNLQTNTPVTAVTTDPSGCNIIHTARGALKASKVIFATNAYTSGICPLFDGQIVPTSSTAAHIRPERPVAPHLSDTYNIAYPQGPVDTEYVDYLNPRPDGGVVVGGAKWTFANDRRCWYDNWDDSVQLPGAKAHFDGLMQRHFLGWESSGAVTDHIWTGIQGVTSDGMPYVGVLPGQEDRQYVLAGYNGGGNAMIFLCAKGVAEMVLRGLPYQATGLPSMFECRQERLHGARVG
ncbi:hypothetical protein LTR53_017499 [Teratosphaeriaceae sp. CCFEE 6253]|nr:hypothetical protein LTR53_017499 [Teratosphaeriaceae sp. CCFEE 6253]